MSLDDRLLNVGLVLIVAGPIIGLILWRLWRGEVRFDGFWTTPPETRAKDKTAPAGKDEKPPAGSDHD